MQPLGQRAAEQAVGALMKLIQRRGAPIQLHASAEEAVDIQQVLDLRILRRTTLDAAGAAVQLRPAAAGKPQLGILRCAGKVRLARTGRGQQPQVGGAEQLAKGRRAQTERPARKRVDIAQADALKTSIKLTSSSSSRAANSAQPR